MDRLAQWKNIRLQIKKTLVQLPLKYQNCCEYILFYTKAQYLITIWEMKMLTCIGESCNSTEWKEQTEKIGLSSSIWLNTNFLAQKVLKHITKFHVNSTSNYKVGYNTPTRCLNLINNKIELVWLNLSFDSYKIQCKNLFLKTHQNEWTYIFKHLLSIAIVELLLKN
jgi:hypothetical protein